MNQKIKLDGEKSQAECLPLSQFGLCENKLENDRSQKKYFKIVSIVINCIVRSAFSIFYK